MFIETEETPNPNSLKFLPGQDLLQGHSSVFFETKSSVSTTCPFALKLFDIEGVESVFIGQDFITITKEASEDWSILKPMILGVLIETLVNRWPIFLETREKTDDGHNASDDPLVKQIIELLDTRIRPSVAQDGGDIVFESFEDGIVYLRLRGACSGCPSSIATLKMGVENLLKYYIPEIKEVRQFAS